MNKIQFFILLTMAVPSLISCGTQKGTIMQPKDNISLDYETFDLDFYEKNKDEQGFLYYVDTDENGTINFISNDQFKNFYVSIAKPPCIFIQTKKFNKVGKLMQKGVIVSNCKIEKWLECDENGENCKIVDYEENRGRFSYSEVLRFLEKKKFIDLKSKIDNSKNFELDYSYEQNQWVITAHYKNSLGYYSYVLDGDSGKILKEEFIHTIY